MLCFFCSKLLIVFIQPFLFFCLCSIGFKEGMNVATMKQLIARLEEPRSLPRAPGTTDKVVILAEGNASTLVHHTRRGTQGLSGTIELWIPAATRCTNKVPTRLHTRSS